jgi:hypothetical protein
MCAIVSGGRLGYTGTEIAPHMASPMSTSAHSTRVRATMATASPRCSPRARRPAAISRAVVATASQERERHTPCSLWRNAGACRERCTRASNSAATFGNGRGGLARGSLIQSDAQRRLGPRCYHIFAQGMDAGRGAGGLGVEARPSLVAPFSIDSARRVAGVRAAETGPAARCGPPFRLHVQRNLPIVRPDLHRRPRSSGRGAASRRARGPCHRADGRDEGG